MIAFEIGCSLFDSSAYAAVSSSFSLIPSVGITSVTRITPVVMVPVLSRATICFFPVSSCTAAVLNRIPLFAPTPFPTIIATGVASPKAQGQLITRTDTALAMAYPKVCPTNNHTIKVTNAMPITTGTNTPETLSAILAIGALVAAASLTIRMIPARVVSSPTLTASQTIYPDVLMVAADTLSPACFSTGTLSPVRADSLTALSPSFTIPSTGMLSPGLTTNLSPTFTSSIWTVFSVSPSRITAVFGASFMRAFSASVVFPFDLASSVFPTVMRVRMVAADSK